MNCNKEMSSQEENQLQFQVQETNLNTQVIIERSEKYTEDSSLLDERLEADESEEFEHNLQEVDESIDDEYIEKDKTQQFRTLKPIQTFGILVNYIIGTGVFGLPFAFQNAGIGLSLIVLVFFYSISLITSMWVLENMARSSGVMEAYRKSRKAEKPHNELEFEVYNYSRMSCIFFGRAGKIASIIFVSFFSYGSLWAYTSVFSSSVTMIMWKYPLASFGECSNDMAEWGLFDKCHSTYLVGIVVFAIIVVPLSLIGVSEQAILQNILTCWRFFCFGLMALTCIIHIIYTSINGEYNPIPDGTSVGKWLFNFAGFGTLFSSCSVALSCHQNLPDCMTPTQPKKHLKKILITGISISSFIYVVIGFSSMLCFGSNTKTPVTHNWLSFSGCAGGFGKCENGKEAEWYGIIIQWLILLFPAVNLASEFPLVCATLSSNLMQIPPKKIREKHPKIWTYGCRLLACIPPIIAGAIKGDLEVIFNFAGIFGFFLLFIIPSLLQIYSKYIIRRKWGSKTYVTVYSGKYSTSYLAWPILVIAVICFSLAFVQFLFDTFGLTA